MPTVIGIGLVMPVDATTKTLVGGQTVTTTTEHIARVLPDHGDVVPVMFIMYWLLSSAKFGFSKFQV